MDEATVAILLKARQEGLEAFDRVKDSLAAIARQAEITNAQLSFIGAAAFVSSNALSGMADASNKTSQNMQGATQAAASSTSIWSTLGSVLMGVVVALGVLAALLAAPFIPIVVAATVVTAAFAVGVGSVVAVLALAFLPLAALSAGIVILAERTNQGQVAMGQLSTALGAMADQLGAKALPMAQQMATWALGMIPLVQQLGNQLLDWFGPRLPAILTIATGTANALFAAFQAAGPVIGKFLDAAIAMAPALIPMFQTILTVGVQAVGGLLTNLLALADWFLQRLPTMGPIVATIMGAIGTAIQTIGKVAGDVVDFFVKNWPQIVTWTNFAFGAIKAGWDAVAPLLQVMLPAALSIAISMMGYLKDNSSLVRDVLIALGAALAIVVATFVILGAGILGVIVSLQWVYDKFNAVNTIVNDVTDSIGRFLDAMSHVPGAGAVFGGTPGGAPSQRPTGVRHGGGPVEAGGTYTVGGPGAEETLTMFAGGGGFVTPGAGGTDMGDTNDLLAACYAVLSRIEANTRGPAFSNAAYGARA